MRYRTTSAVTATALLLGGSLTACGGSDDAEASGGALTYWATNMAPTPADDEAVLTPELEKFTEETGIEVELEVVPWKLDALHELILLDEFSEGRSIAALFIVRDWLRHHGG